MKQFFKVFVNLIFGIAFATMFFLLTFEPKEFEQYAGFIIGIGVAFMMNKINASEIDKLKDEIDKLKNNHNENNI